MTLRFIRLTADGVIDRIGHTDAPAFALMQAEDAAYLPAPPDLPASADLGWRFDRTTGVATPPPAPTE